MMVEKNDEMKSMFVDACRCQDRFLYGELDEDVFIKLPAGYLKLDNTAECSNSVQAKGQHGSTAYVRTNVLPKLSFPCKYFGALKQSNQTMRPVARQNTRAQQFHINSDSQNKIKYT